LGRWLRQDLCCTGFDGQRAGSRAKNKRPKLEVLIPTTGSRKEQLDALLFIEKLARGHRDNLQYGAYSDVHRNTEEH
jgi:hypothetical protein